jgi:hypothetical protein
MRYLEGPIIVLRALRTKTRRRTAERTEPQNTFFKTAPRLNNKRVPQAPPLKDAVLWDVRPCGSCKNRRFGRRYHLHHQRDKNRRARINVSSKLQTKHDAKLLQEPHGVTSQKMTFFIISPRKPQILLSINLLGSVAET